MERLYLGTGIHGMITTAISKNVGSTPIPSKMSRQQKPTTSLSSRFSFKYPLRYLWPGIEKSDLGFNNERENWVLNEKSLVEQEQGNGGIIVNSYDDDEKCDFCTDVDDNDNGDEESFDLCRVDDENLEDEIKFDRVSFSSLLKKVSMAEAKLYAKLSYLGYMTYSISKIQPESLLKSHQLRFVTSSLEKKEQLAKSEKSQTVGEEVHEPGNVNEAMEKDEEQKNIVSGINASAAYQIAASAASYLHSQTKSILPFKSSEENPGNDYLPNDDERADLLHSEMASFMATTVGAKEDGKQAIADDLNSLDSSPCDWFICDDDQIRTRYFVIQGSESLASWQANLLFEPVQFEGLDVLVHRGIYEIARGIYEQMLPEIHAHLKSNGDRATMRFTGHSLGGSLALLVNLMLLIRREVPVSSLLPVIAFGAPYVMCGGDRLLQQLGLPKNHFKGIAMHRDIVPRAFSSTLSNHIVELLKAVNGNFRSHPCLSNQKLMFAPMGEVLILQPDEKLSPHHHLLPPGNGLYLLTNPISGDGIDTEKLIHAATKVFLNSPHPLEILSDRSAYGFEGNIMRDHDVQSYLKAIRNVIRQDLNRARRDMREKRRKIWWPLVGSSNIGTSVLVGHQPRVLRLGQRQLISFAGMLQTGRNSVKRFSRLVASQHMHLLVVMLYPARLFLLETFRISVY